MCECAWLIALVAGYVTSYSYANAGCSNWLFILLLQPREKKVSVCCGRNPCPHLKFHLQRSARRLSRPIVSTHFAPFFKAHILSSSGIAPSTNNNSAQIFEENAKRMRWQTAFQTSRGEKMRFMHGFLPSATGAVCDLLAENEVWVTDRIPFLFACACAHTARAVSFSAYSGDTKESPSSTLSFWACCERLKIKVIGSSWAPLFVWKGRWRNLHRKPNAADRATNKVYYTFRFYFSHRLINAPF